MRHDIGALQLTRVLYADAVVPAEIAGLTPEQVESVPWHEPVWCEGSQLRASASAWVVEGEGRRIVLDPMQAADQILHEPEGAAFHREAIAEIFAKAGFPLDSIDTVCMSHIEGVGMVGYRDNAAWRLYFPNARVCVSEAARDSRGFSNDALERDAWTQLFDAGVVDTYADGEMIVPGMRAETSKAHNPGHSVFHFGAGPDATFLGHLAVSPIHLATGLCPQQHPDPELAWKLLHEYADDGRLLIGPLWPSPGCGRWVGDEVVPAGA